MKAAVLLSGCGVYDGSEIHEAVFTLLALEQLGYTYNNYAIDKKQHHVINHTNGEEMEESRNCMVESARITRGNIKDLRLLDMNHYDVLIVIGGFGAAKNINEWALSGPYGTIDAIAKEKIRNTLEYKKTLVGICMGPTVIAKAFEETKVYPVLSVGDREGASEYDITAIHEGMESIGAKCIDTSKGGCIVDMDNKIISIPAYMMKTNMKDLYTEIYDGIKTISTL